MKKHVLVLCISFIAISFSGCAKDFVNKTIYSSSTPGPLLTPTNEQIQSLNTSNWQTYKGNHFTIKYPTNFSLTILGKGAEYLSSNTSVEQFFKPDTLRNDQIVVTLLDGLLEKYDESEFQTLANRLVGGSQQNIPYSVITIGGMKAVKVIYLNTEHYGIPTRSGLVWISAKPVNSNLMPTFETVMSTVKFQ